MTMLANSTRQVDVMHAIGSRSELRALVDRFGADVYEALHPLIDDQLVEATFTSSEPETSNTAPPLRPRT